MRNPFRYFNSSPEVIRLAVMMYIRYPLSRRQVEDLLFERGIDICHETVRFWWNRFGPMFAVEIRKRRVHHSSSSQWRWHLDEAFVKINGDPGFEVNALLAACYTQLGRETEASQAMVNFMADAPEEIAKRPLSRRLRPLYPQQPTFWTRLGMSQVDPGCVRT